MLFEVPKKSQTFYGTIDIDCTCFAIFTLPVVVDPEKDCNFVAEIRPQMPVKYTGA